MNIRVWYKVPAPPIESEPGEIVISPDHIVTTRDYRDIQFSIDGGVLAIESQFYPHTLIALYREFDRVEPIGD